MSIEELTAISRYYGSNSDYVIAGGGNTSFKDSSTLYIKGSGTALADSTPESFVLMDRQALQRIWGKTYSADPDAREREVLAAMMDARKPGEEQKRPSVETLLHDILPFPWVVHTHPALVNGLTCSQQGEAAVKELFGEEALWIPAANPGYILSQKVKRAIDAYGRRVDLIFLQNHGIFVSGDSPAGIKERYQYVMEKITGKIRRRADLSERIAQWGISDDLARFFADLTGSKAVFLRNKEIGRLVTDSISFYPVSSAFTPDHIVYAGSDPLFVDARLEDIQRLWNSHIEKTKVIPKIAAVQGMGIFGIGTSEKAAVLGLELFTDAVKVAVYTESFGGPRFMPQDQIDFINNWEVERYRSRISAG